MLPGGCLDGHSLSLKDNEHLHAKGTGLIPHQTHKVDEPI